MPLPPKKKRPEESFELLVGEEEDPEEIEDGEFAEDYEDEFSEDTPSEDPLAAEGPSIDPEQASLCEQLGFTEPEQQQALLDLIKLVAAPAPELNPSPAPMGASLEGF